MVPRSSQSDGRRESAIWPRVPKHASGRTYRRCIGWNLIHVSLLGTEEEYLRRVHVGCDAESFFRNFGSKISEISEIHPEYACMVTLSPQAIGHWRLIGREEPERPNVPEGAGAGSVGIERVSSASACRRAHRLGVAMARVGVGVKVAGVKGEVPPRGARTHGFVLSG